MVAEDDSALVFPLHAGARKAYLAEALICVAGIIFSPWFFWYMAVRRRAKVVLFRDRLEVTYFRTRSIPLEDIERLGLVSVPFRPRGLRGWMETQRCRGHEALHACLRLVDGQDFSFHFSQYESSEEILDLLEQTTGLSYESVRGGFASLIWPKRR